MSSPSSRIERRALPPRDVLQERLRAALEPRPGIRLAFLFGSTARGEAGPLSDADVAVLLDRRPGLEDLALLATDLEAAAGTSKIDLVILNEAPPLLRHRVVRDGIPLLVRDESEALRFRVEAIRDHLDFEPMRRVQQRYLEASLVQRTEERG